MNILRDQNLKKGRIAQRCIIATAVWGKPYIEMFTTIVLPNLLSSGNLPAMVEILNCEFRIYSRHEDIEYLRRHEFVQRLCEIMPVQVFDFGKRHISASTATQSMIFQDIMRDAASCNAALCYCMPDAIWSDGSYREVGTKLVLGYRAIMQPSIRVVSETILPELHERIDAKGILTLHSEDTMSLGLAHIHPLTACYHRASKRYPRHAELVLTAVGKHLGMTYHFRDPKVLVPGKIDLTRQLLVGRNTPSEFLDSVTDPRQIFGLSLTPLMQDTSWYRRRHNFSYEEAGRSWFDFDSPHNDATARELLILTPSKQVSEHILRKSQLTIRQRAAGLSSARALHALIVTLSSCNCGLAAQLLSGAVRWARAHRSLLTREPITVLVPHDDAIGKSAPAIFNYLRPGREVSLLYFLRRHVFPTREIRNGKATSLAGTMISIKRGDPSINFTDIGEVFRGIHVIISDKLIVSPEDFT